MHGAAFGGLIFLGLACLMYFLPTIVAHQRQMPNLGSVVVVNALLGWTFIGWIVALAMACGNNRSNQVTVVNHNSQGWQR